MRQLTHIIKYKSIAYFKSSSRLSLISFLKEFGSFIVYGGFAIGAYYFSQSIIEYLLIQAKIGMFLLHEFIATILFIFFLSINAGNIIVSFSTLYKSDEVYFLFTKPIDPTKIFLIKFLDNFFYSSSTMMMFMLSLLAGYSAYFNLSIASIVAIFTLNFIPFMITAGSIGVIILLLLIKLASKIGVRTVLSILAVAYILLIFSFFNIISPGQLVNDVMKFYPNVDQYFGNLIPDTIKYLPNHWVSESLYWISLGKIDDSIPYFIYQISVSLTFFIIALYLGFKWYHQTWFFVLDFRNQKSKKQKVDKKYISFSSGSIIRPIYDSMIKKDLFAFLREPSQIIHFMVLVFLIIIFLFSLKGIKLNAITSIYLKTIIYLSIQLFNLLLITTLSLRFVFPLLSLEGRTFWRIKSAPINNLRYMYIRLLPWIIIITIISEMLSIVTVSIFSFRLIVFSAVITFIISSTIIMINFGMGTLFVNYKEKNPIRLASSQGASLTFLLCIIYMLFIVVVQLVPMNQIFLLQNRNIVYSNMQFYYISILIAIISVFIYITFFFIAKKSIAKDF